MAIHKISTTGYGGNAEHHIVEEIIITRNTDKVAMRMEMYHDATAFTNGNPYYPPQEYLRTVRSTLPQAIQDTINTLKQQLEDYAIANAPKYSGGVRVNDDGSPVT